MSECTARTRAEIDAEYWKKELDELQPKLRYAMYVQHKLSEARQAMTEEQK
jgi:hypothetical protein